MIHIYHVGNEEVLLRVNEQRNILKEIRKRKANWIGHILRRNCLLQQVIEGKIKGQIEVTRRRGRRRKKLLDDFKDRRGYCQLKEEALDRTMWRNRFGRDFGPVIWQITDDDDDITPPPRVPRVLDISRSLTRQPPCVLHPLSKACMRLYSSTETDPVLNSVLKTSERENIPYFYKFFLPDRNKNQSSVKYSHWLWGLIRPFWPKYPNILMRLRSKFPRPSNHLKPSGHYMYRTMVTKCTQCGHYMYRPLVTICTAQWSLYVPPIGHYMYRTVVTICTQCGQ